MRLSARRLLSLALIGLIGFGVFLMVRKAWGRACLKAHQSEAISIVLPHVPTLLEGLTRSQAAMSMEEHDVIMRMNKDERVASVLYLNRYGDVRWYRDPRPMHGCMFSIPELELPTDAVEQASRTKSPVTRKVPGIPLYDVAIPLTRKGEILGVLDIQVPSLKAAQIARKACSRMPSL